jgi:hypothetical protein
MLVEFRKGQERLVFRRHTALVYGSQMEASLRFSLIQSRRKLYWNKERLYPTDTARYLPIFPRHRKAEQRNRLLWCDQITPVMAMIGGDRLFQPSQVAGEPVECIPIRCLIDGDYVRRQAMGNRRWMVGRVSQGGPDSLLDTRATASAPTGQDNVH